MSLTIRLAEGQVPTDTVIAYAVSDEVAFQTYYYGSDVGNRLTETDITTKAVLKWNAAGQKGDVRRYVARETGSILAVIFPILLGEIAKLVIQLLVEWLNGDSKEAVAYRTSLNKA